jgi:hypothetical protein
VRMKPDTNVEHSYIKVMPSFARCRAPMPV